MVAQTKRGVCGLIERAAYPVYTVAAISTDTVTLIERRLEVDAEEISLLPEVLYMTYSGKSSESYYATIGELQTTDPRRTLSPGTEFRCVGTNADKDTVLVVTRRGRYHRIPLAGPYKPAP